jgi:hypothetical protein
MNLLIQLSGQQGRQTVQEFWQAVNWDDAEIFISDRPWNGSVQQYFAAIPWANVATNISIPTLSAQPEKATLENFLDDISQFF